MSEQQTPEYKERFIAAIAHKLAEIDGYDDESLFQLRWSGGVAPEPLGDAFSMDYLPEAEKLMDVIYPEIEKLEQQRDELLAAIAAWEANPTTANEFAIKSIAAKARGNV